MVSVTQIWQSGKATNAQVLTFRKGKFPFLKLKQNLSSKTHFDSQKLQWSNLRRDWRKSHHYQSYQKRDFTLPVKVRLQQLSCLLWNLVGVLGSVNSGLYCELCRELWCHREILAENEQFRERRSLARSFQDFARTTDQERTPRD